MVMRMTILHHHIVADLPAHAIAIVVARLHLAEGQPTTVLRKNTPGVIAVEVFIVRSVAIKGDVFNGHMLHMLAVQNREKRGRRRVSGKPEVLAQACV